MTGEFFTDWALMALSLLNMVLLFWLGGTVLLNAERRTWALRLAGSGLLLGGLFFLSHSAILGRRLMTLDGGVRFWSRIALSAAILLPFAWYVLTLWYAGFWEPMGSTLRRRHTPWLLLTLGLVLVGGVIAVIVANYLFQPSLIHLRWWLATVAVANVPVVALGYALYILLCFLLALEALSQPAPSGRVMGELARQRARPWLIATTLTLLGVALLVGWAILTVGPALRRDVIAYLLSSSTVRALAWFDLLISALVAVSTLLLGQAIVAYEVFTGKTLPRGGLRRHWRNAVLLAAGYGIIVGLSLALRLQLVYSLLLTTLLMTVFYTLLSWRSYAERERYIQDLRPFVASHRLYEQLLVSAPHELDVATPFHALCRDVLGARVAYLAATGPLAPLVGAPLVHPPARPMGSPPLPWLPEVVRRATPEVACIPLDPRRHGEALWGVPLWSERGLIGLLLLGEKRDRGLYTQEEIEIAQASGERLIDTRASAELARRLMALQRQRLTESQVLDYQTRRVVHDEVLPTLHTAMLALTEAPPASNGQPPAAMALLAEAHRTLSDLLRAMPPSAAPEVARLGLIGALQRVVAGDLRRAFDAVAWEIEPAAAAAAERLPPLAAEVIFYAAREAIRNAARHGRGAATRPLALRVALRYHGALELCVEDDGVGLDAGSSGGTGQGLSLHSTMMAVIGGALVAESAPGSPTRITLSLPMPS